MHLSGSQPCEYALTAERVLGNGLAFRVIHKMHAAELTWRYFCNCYERKAFRLPYFGIATVFLRSLAPKKRHLKDDL
jgi:hypothetical protein